VNGEEAFYSQGGSGAGGSVFLMVGTLAGSGTISAKGATNYYGYGAGGGGRIAIYRTNSTFTGTITAAAGLGAYPGGAGTVIQVSPVLISGTVQTTNGLPVVGASVGAVGVVSTLTRAAGDYSLVVPSGWSGTLSATKSGLIFSPASRSYVTIASDQTSQDFAGMPLSAPALELVSTNAAIRLQWPSLTNVQYMLQSSTNLVDWTNFGSVRTGTGNNLRTTIPATNIAPQFFRLSATN